MCTGERGGGKDTQCVQEREVEVRIHSSLCKGLCSRYIYIERERSAQKSLAPS